MLGPFPHHDPVRYFRHARPGAPCGNTGANRGGVVMASLDARPSASRSCTLLDVIVCVTDVIVCGTDVIVCGTDVILCGPDHMWYRCDRMLYGCDFM